MKREVTKLTNNTFYINMIEYYGEDSIEKISKREHLTGDKLIEYLYKKLYREIKMFLIGRMEKQTTYDKNRECTQILIIEYNELTWVLEVNHKKFMQHFYIDYLGNKRTFLPFGTGKTSIVEERDELVIESEINDLK